MSISRSKLKSEILEMLQSWTNGEKQPTFNQLEKLSKATHIPLGYFFLQNPPKETCSVLEYRTICSIGLQNPSRNLLDTVRHMEDIQDWMHDYLIGNSAQAVAFVGFLNPKHDVYAASNAVRMKLALNDDWYTKSNGIGASFKRLRNAISNLGILVMQNGVVGNNTHRPLDVDEFRAFSLIDKYAPLIFVNWKDSDGGRLFSLIHELVHIGLGESNLLNTDGLEFVSPLETFCNKVTSEILVPDSHFGIAWREHDGDNEFKVKRIATHFRCSQSVIVRRLLDKGFIGHDEYNMLRQKARNLSKVITKPSEGGDYWATMLSRVDHRFIKALNSSLNEGHTLYTEACRLTNTNHASFGEMIGKLEEIKRYEYE